MKRAAIFVAAFVFILVLTKIANRVPPPPTPGTTFSLKAHRVIQCSATDITLVDHHEEPTHLEKDDSWPDCSILPPNVYLDFYLSRGDKTKYLTSERSEWWRYAL